MSMYAAMGLTQFLSNYPGMDVYPVRGSDLRLEGVFTYSAEWKDYGLLTDAFTLRINIPELFPKALPTVHELDGRIPRTQEYHINQDDHSLCLGSPLRLLKAISVEPTLSGFSKRCLTPYLYAVSRKLLQGGELLFGELAHGRPGELADYLNMFGLGTNIQAMRAIRYLGMKKRLANKLSCPCDCGRRLGVCTFNRRLRSFRLLAQRNWYRKALSNFLESNLDKRCARSFSYVEQMVREGRLNLDEREYALIKGKTAPMGLRMKDYRS